MSPIPTTPSSSARSASGSRGRRWSMARPQIRVGIDFDDDGFRLAAIRLSPRCDSPSSSQLSLQWLHRVAERTPPMDGDLAGYLEALASRLPRYATRGGVAASIAMPPTAQSLRCVPSSQLAEAERGIADELGGEVQCRSWPVGAQKSMICGVRRDIAESMIAILRDVGYRCDSILPRSIALARTLLAATQAAEPNATILCWGRRRTLVTTIHDQTIRLCREFMILEPVPCDPSSEGGNAPQDTSEDRLTQVASEIADELMLTLQHASRLNSRIVLGPIIVCGPMSADPQAIQLLRPALNELFDGKVEAWQFSPDAHSGGSSVASWDRADAVAASLAIGGSRLAADQVQAGVMLR